MMAVSHSIGVERYSELDVFDKLILLCISSGQAIRHADISPSLPLHAADISKRLARLVARGFLKSEGRARGMKYTLAYQTPTSQNREMSKLPGEMSKLMSEESYPAEVLAIRNRNWTSKRDMQDAIVTLCTGNWRSITSLATILQRDPRTIARHCLELIKQGLAEAKYPDSLRHPPTGISRRDS